MEKLMKFYYRKLANNNLKKTVVINDKNMMSLSPFISAMAPRLPGEPLKLLGMRVIRG